MNLGNGLVFQQFECYLCTKKRVWGLIGIGCGCHIVQFFSFFVVISVCNIIFFDLIISEL